MTQTVRQILHNHKPKLILVSVGIFIALLLNSEVFYLPQNAASKVPAGLSNRDSESKQKTSSAPRKITDVSIVNTYIRENLYYTQGLAFKDANTLIESAGLYQKSAILYLDASTMKVLDSKPMNPTYFGEGCEYVKRGDEEEIYQLTWRERKIVVWNAKDLTVKKELDLPREIREGWGIVKRYEKDEDGKEVLNFYVSDGTHKIYVVDAETWKVKKTLAIQKQKNEIVRNLNELEFVKGKLWANIYYSNQVAVIDPATGMIESMIDLSQFIKLAQEKSKELKTPWQQDYVLNGIAYHEAEDRLIITGKNWPIMWEVKVNGL